MHAEPGQPHHSAALLQFARADLERAVRAGESRCAERCLARLSGIDADATLDLIYSEFLLREQLGQSPTAEQWLARFPQLAVELRELFDVHEAIVGETVRVPPAPTLDPASSEPASSDASPTDATALVGGTFRLDAELGRGGMGVVYRAFDTRLCRPVAIKFLHATHGTGEGGLERFRREAVAASALNSPNLCAIYAFDEHLGQPFIAMELVDGSTLGDWAAGGKSLRDLAALVAQAARALAVAHAAGVVHRDIKPGNLMVRSDGLLKVLDFGMARFTPAAGAVTALATQAGHTTPGTLIGTIAYMSPEQARGETAGPASDVFSLGVVLYELATGRHPFESSSQVGLLGAIVDRAPLAPSRVSAGCPRTIDELILRMLAKDPALRPTADTVAAMLRQWADGADDALAEAAAAVPMPIGRDAELAVLAGGFDAAADGRGGVLCVSGEPGIGKTTLIEAFLAAVASRRKPVGIAHGRSSERLAGSEAYLPVLEALDGLLRGDPSGALAAMLRTLAPSWSARLIPTADTPPGTPSTAVASTQERTKRELLAFFDAACRDRPVVLFLDDQQWGDPSTADLLSYLGHKCGQMRLLILLGYRPTDLVLARHPLLSMKQELEARGLCREIPLSLLGRADVGAYLDATFPGHCFSDDFAEFVQTKTGGNPLFLVNLLRYLRDVGVIASLDGVWTLAKAVPDFRRELPQSVRSMVQRKIDQLPDADRRLLTAAGVQGQEFDASVVAAAIGADAADVEDRLAALERVHAIVRRVREQEFPDGTLTVRYAFVHVLYQNALYAALQPARRAMLGGVIAAALLSCHRGRGAGVAAELALLLEVARDFRAAAEHCCLAARGATSLFAYREACAWARRGLSLVPKIPDDEQRDRLELALQASLGINNIALSHFATPEVSDSLTRAEALSRKLNDASELSSIHWGLFLFHAACGQYVASHAAAGELLSIAETGGDRVARLAAHPALALTHLHRGEHAESHRHAAAAARLFEGGTDVRGWSQIGQDPKTVGIAFGAVSAWFLGFADRARRECARSIAVAVEPASMVFAHFVSAWVASCCRDFVATRRFADAMSVLAEAHNFTFWAIVGRCFGGVAAAGEGREPEAAALLRDGLEAFEQLSAVVLAPLFTLPLCEILAKAGRTDEAMAEIERVRQRADANANRYFEAECWRVQGDLLAARDPDHPDVDACHRRALEIARRQGTKALELRAAISIAGRPGSRDEAVAAAARLRSALEGFTEGFDTGDYVDAVALLRSIEADAEK